MKRVFTAVGVSLALAWGTGGPALRAQDPANSLSLTFKNLPPGSSLSVAMNGGKIGSASTNGTASQGGTLDLVLNIANRGKIVEQVEVYVDDCSTNPPSTKVYLVEAGAKPPDDNCNRRKIGAFWLNKTRRLTIQNNKLSTGGLSRNQWILIGGGGAAAAVIVGVTAGGDSSSTSSGGSTGGGTTGGGTTGGGGTGGGGTTTIVTNGTYTVVFTSTNDPNGHAPFVLYQLITQLVVNGTGSTATVTGNQRWQPGSATVANGILSFDFCGTVAGRTGIRIRGTLTVTASGAMSGTVTVGESGGCATQALPGNPPQIVYTVSGQRTAA